MKINSIVKGLAVIAVMLLVACGFMHTAYAASKTAQHTVTASVPSTLSIAADTSNFTLTFSDFVSGAETNVQPVVYTVRGNNVTKTTGVVAGQLSDLFTGMDLQAKVGPYTKTSGNASLLASSGNFTSILATSAVGLADRVLDSGSGKSINGKLPIDYKAVATQDLDAGDQTKTLTVSFIDT
jgi:hypothetical protein